MATKVTTNNVPRPIIDAFQLSMSAKAEFHYLDWEAIKDGRESASFFRYKGTLYDIGEFSRLTTSWERKTFPKWDGVLPDSYFSGLLLRYVDDESVIIGSYYTS